MLRELHGKHVLLLQGPMGPFFHRLGRELKSVGASRVSKINFNGGDVLFYPGPDARTFRGTLEEWPQFFTDFVKNERVDVVMLFGDQRAYHSPIQMITSRVDVALYVFEEGYLRPNYITLEPGGVNGRSSIPQQVEAFANMPSKLMNEPKNRMTAYYHSIVYSVLYHIAMSSSRWLFPRYRHHRPMGVFYNGLRWIRGWFRRFWFGIKERGVLQKLKAGSGEFFLVPLQVKDDAQVRVWSDYSSVKEFIEEVVVSFSLSAGPQDKLVLKHHPMDRAYSDYGWLVKRLQATTGLGERLIYIHDVPMPELLDHAKGVVCINSTSGISAMQHRVPVRTMGNAIYNLPGLVSDAPLPEFWRSPGKVDMRLFCRFRNWLLVHNQLHGSFYRRLPGVLTPTGIIWNPVEAPDTAMPCHSVLHKPETLPQ